LNGEALSLEGGTRNVIYAVERTRGNSEKATRTTVRGVRRLSEMGAEEVES